jgi:hypothetical protein
MRRAGALRENPQGVEDWWYIYWYKWCYDPAEEEWVEVWDGWEWWDLHSRSAPPPTRCEGPGRRSPGPSLCSGKVGTLPV